MTSRIACTTTLSLLLAATATACGDDGGSGDTENAESSATTTSPASTTDPTTGPTTGPTTTTAGPTTGPTTEPTTTTTTDPTDTEDPDTGSESTGVDLPCPYTPIDGEPNVGLELVAEGFNQGLDVIGDPIDADVIYVVEHGGRIKRIEPGVTTAPAENWLEVNVSGGTGGNERGLFSLAFHPDYETNNLIYISSTPSNLGGAVAITEYSVEDGVVNTGSARVVVAVGQHNSNHNGGQIAFGPDGMLYFALGDGGGADDSCNLAQIRTTPLSKILRIDPTPDGTPDSMPACPGGCNCAAQDGFDYTIPADNPYVGDDAVLDEVWAEGFRNPWRFSFDPMDGRLWVSDVGQDLWEEVTLVERGTNHGWSDMEGFHCFQGAACDEDAAPGTENADGYVMPIAEYAHSQSRYSISGVGVYRSCEVPAFAGYYFYGELGSGEIFAVSYDGTTATGGGVVAQLPNNLVPFGGGTNAYGDVFIAANPNPYVGGGPGSVYRITAAE